MLLPNTEPQGASDINAAGETRKRRFDAVDNDLEVQDVPTADEAKKPKLETHSYIDEDDANKIDEQFTQIENKERDETGDKMVWTSDERDGTIGSTTDRIVIDDKNTADADTCEGMADIRTRGLRKRKNIEPEPQAGSQDPPPTRLEFYILQTGCLLAPLAVGQLAYVMVRCPPYVRPSVR